MDVEGTGRISSKKIEEHLRDSGLYSLPLSRALKVLCNKMDYSQVDGSLSLSKFMNWLGRSYNPVATAAMKLRYVCLSLWFLTKSSEHHYTLLRFLLLLIS